MNASALEPQRKTAALIGLELLALLLILSLAAYLRLVNLESVPGWYSDEGTLIDIADNLLHGRWQYLSLNQSTLIVARLPLFVGLLSGLFRLFGTDITVLRGFTACLGLLSVLLVYLLLRRVQRGKSPWQALLAALMLAIYPQAVVYSRLGFSYNLLTPLVLLACLALWNYLESGHLSWLAAGCLAVGLGVISDISTFIFALPVVLVISTRGWRSVLWSIIWLAMPISIYVAWMLSTVPQAFLFDLQFTLSRLGEIPLLLQLPVVLLNYYYLLTKDVWFLAGVAGLFLAQPLRWRYLLLCMFLLPLVSLGRSAGFGISWDYYLIPLFPFIAIGTASLVWAGAPLVLRTFRGGTQRLLQSWGWNLPAAGWLQARTVVLVSSLGLFMVVFSPLLITFVTSWQAVRGELNTGLDPVLVDSMEARQAAAYINQQVGPDDLVIASPAVSWLIRSRTADFQHSLAAQGIATIHLPGDIPAERFAFDPRISQARYVLVDRIWRNWAAANIPEAAEMLADVQNWNLEYRAGEFEVYRSPIR